MLPWSWPLPSAHRVVRTERHAWAPSDTWVGRAPARWPGPGARPATRATRPRVIGPTPTQS